MASAATTAAALRIASSTGLTVGAVHLDRGYAGAATQQALTERGLTGVVARKGVPAPLQVGHRWVVERTQAWMNGYGKLRRCTERAGAVVDFYLFLAATFVVVR